MSVHSVSACASACWFCGDCHSPAVHAPAAEDDSTKEEEEPQGLQHDDDIGEEIPYGEAEVVCHTIVQLVRCLCCMTLQQLSAHITRRYC